MNKFVILLACLASLAAAGVVDKSRKLGLVDLIDNVAEVEEIGTDRRILRMTQEQLLRQKFILDLLQHVQQPLINEELLQLADTLIVDQDRYTERIDEEMLHIIELCRQQLLLGNNEVFTITNEDHIRQMIGLYRLLQRSRDWDTFQRNACYARRHINGVLFVNALLLAIRDRVDTQMLIVPGLHEILPELYYDDDLVMRARSIDINELTTDTETMRPGLMDLVGLGRRIKANRNIGVEQRIGGGLDRWGLRDRTQLWMPWREMRMELALRRSAGEKVHIGVRNENKLVIPVEERGQSRLLSSDGGSMSLLTQDIGLKSFLHGLINELILRESELQGETNINEESDRLERIGGDRIRIRDSMLEREKLGREYGGIRDEGADTDRLLHIGRRRLNRVIQEDDDDDDDERQNRLNLDRMMQRERIVDGRRVSLEDERQARRDRPLQSKRQRTLIKDDLDIDQFPTTGIDNERLLHVNRRRLQTDAAQNYQQRQIDEDIEDRLRLQRVGPIVNGRRVADQEQQLRRNVQNQQRFRDSDRDILDFEQRQQNDRDDDDDDDLPTTNINNPRLLHINRRRLQTTTTDQLQDQRRDGIILDNKRERFMNLVTGRVRDGRRIHDDIIDRRRLGKIIDDEDDDDDRITTRGRISKLERNRQRIQDIEEEERRLLKQRGGRMNIFRDDREQRLDIDLPTTNIDNERLLHINRRRLDQDQGNEDINEEILQRRRYSAVGDGRRVKDVQGERLQDRVNVDQQIKLQRLIEEREMGIRRTNINNERLLHVNRRRLNNDDNDSDIGVNRDSQRSIREGRRIIEQDIDEDIDEKQRGRSDMGLRRNSIDNERLLQLIRRRLNKEIAIVENNDDTFETGRTLGRIGDDDEDLREYRRIKMSIPRGMGDIGTVRDIEDNDDDVEQQQPELQNERSWLNQQRLLKRMRDYDDRRTLTDRRQQIDEDRLLVTGRRRRLPRSLVVERRLNNQDENSRSGEHLLHQLQQLMARINMERISLGINVVEGENQLPQRVNRPLLNSDAGKDQRYALRLNDKQLETRRNRMFIEQLNKIEKRLRETVIEQVARDQQDDLTQTNIDRLVGDILLGRRTQQADISLLNILRGLLLNADERGFELEQQTLGNVGVLLQDPILQLVLRRIIRVVDQQRQQQLGSYRSEDLQLDGVRINDISVDKLRTFIDSSDTDLINLLDARLAASKMLVARQQRLNHKSFTIKLDLSADRPQRVIIRTLLGPKLDTAGHDVLSLDEQRLNFMLLDATVADLRAGRNTIQRRSQDITWTARDTTTYTELYQRVLLAIDGKIRQDDILLQSPIVGQQSRFPHRLLLPRGRVGGLPMQLLVIVTPVVGDEEIRTRQSEIRSDSLSSNGVGIDALNMDRLPLGFPLDRQINDVQQLLSLPNLRLQDVLIHHDD